MKITDEMVTTAVHAWQEANGADQWNPESAMRFVVEQVAPLIAKAYVQQLLDCAAVAQLASDRGWLSGAQ